MNALMLLNFESALVWAVIGTALPWVCLMVNCCPNLRFRMIKRGLISPLRVSERMSLKKSVEFNLAKNIQHKNMALR